MRCSEEYSRPNSSWNGGRPSEPRRDIVASPKKSGRGMPEMPSGPLVTSYQLISTMRMISPNPRVTMAK